tara:strand:- start:3409 stop:3684 length:276 start_codon:yes stop_codon:yes gene_type:complete
VSRGHVDQLTKSVLADAMANKDFRKVITLEPTEDLCGPGPSYKIQIQVKRYNKVPDSQSNPTLVESWETVKTYAINVEEIGNGTHGALPMD